MNIYVGNLSKETTENDLNGLFAEQGEIKSVKIIMDHFTGQSRGFGFVEMYTQADGMKAISSLNGTELNGQELKVNEARPRNDDRNRGRRY